MLLTFFSYQMSDQSREIILLSFVYVVPYPPFTPMC